MPYEQAQSLGKGEKKKASLLYKSSRLAGVCLAMGNLYIPDAPMAIMCENIQTYVSKIPIRQTKQYERGERNYTTTVLPSHLFCHQIYCLIKAQNWK